MIPENRRLISSGSPFEAEYAYSRAVAQGDWCFVAGTTGYDYETMSMPEDPLAQARNIFLTMRKALGEAGFGLEHLVRINAFVTAVPHWEAAAPALREFLGEIRPANTLIVTALMTPEMKIEISGTAFRG